MSLTEDEQKMIDAATAATNPTPEPKPAKKVRIRTPEEEVKEDVAEVVDAPNLEDQLPTHDAEGNKLGPRARRIAYLKEITNGEIRGLSKLSVAKLDEKIQEIHGMIEAQEAEVQEGEGNEIETTSKEDGEQQPEPQPQFSIEEIRDGAKFCAQLAAQGLLGVEKVTHSTCGTTGIDCTGAYSIYNGNPLFQQHAEKGWEKLLAENPKLVQKILGPWFYLGNAYATPCAIAAATNLRAAKATALQE